ncbi:hypothetical protein BC830DRAFT_1141520 [Chytriomyces sp. MP71]|nr:hypothetical protein BC830DRAFT_1141520 [Chytriomyces sp. MP71]
MSHACSYLSRSEYRLMECGNPGCKTFYCRCPNCRERLAFQCLRCGYVCCRDSDLNCIDGMRECASCLGFYCCGCIMTHVVACGF